MAETGLETDQEYRNALCALMARSDFERGHVANPFVDAAAGERGLRRVAALLDRLDCPQDRFGIVHVAGSKGKGSTGAIVASALGAAGYRTGFYTSPHLHSIRERIAVNGAAITEPAFANVARRAVAAAEALEGDEPDLGRVTTFELLTAMGFAAFARARCDLAVVEVGLGGSYDATNVITPSVSVITRLDLEHVAVLGDSLEAIAAAKAGIIKPGRPVVVSPEPAAALAVIEVVAAERGSPLLVGGRDWRWSGSWRSFAATGRWGALRELRVGLAGPHQVENACTALASLWTLRQDGLAIPEAAIRQGLADVRWPGRFERVERTGRATVVLDGAHSPGSAAALAATLAAEEPGRPAVLVLGALADKDLAAIARALAPVTTTVVATRADHPRAADLSAVAAAAVAAGLVAEVDGEVPAALARAESLAGPDGLVVVAGSLATVAAARVALGLATAEPKLG